MGKRLRDYRNNGGTSTDSDDETKMNGGETCSHITNLHVDSQPILDCLKKSGFDKFCSECISRPGIDHASTNGLVGDKSVSLWLCLKCGTQLCGRFANKHAIAHATRRDHTLAMDTVTFDIWCYSCDNQVHETSKIVQIVKRELSKQPNAVDLPFDIEKLQVMTDLMQSLKINNASGDGTDQSTSRESSIEKYKSRGPSVGGGVIVISSPADKETRGGSITLRNKPSFNVDSLPRVRGLSNLGNTCFFNAVLQCLARTPYMLTILKKSPVEGGKVVIPGGKLKLPDGSEVELPVIEGELGAWRKLTRYLADVLTQLTDSTPGVITPKQLLAELGNKLPQFAGREQHDSHELLRQLLESVRREDQKRYEELIIPKLGVEPRRANDKPLDENLKAKVRFYGDQISQQVLRPEQIFRGSLVSTLTCQDCHHTSSNHEYFLDLSLPVCVEKPQPPGTIWAAGKTKSFSKKECAREKKAKRMAKHLKNKKNLSSAGDEGEAGDAPSPVGDGPEAKDDGDDEEDNGDNESSDDSNEPPDADVEDNDVTDDALSKVEDEGTGQASTGQTPEKLDDTPENQDKESTNGAKRAMRQRTISHADWSNTIAPRYQCKDGEYSVQSCFNNFTTVELMIGNNKVCCDVCTERINGKNGKSVNTNATKQFLVSVPPAVLILHLKRFMVEPRGHFKKINKAVSFPFVLDIAPFCGSKVKRAAHVRPGQKKILYALYGLVEHSGSMYGGHYVAYVKVRPPIDSKDLRWKFIPLGSKDELDRKSEEEMVKEQARRMMGTHATSGGASADDKENDTEEADPDEEGAVGLGSEPEQDVEPPPGKWYYVSDSLVREVSEDIVLKVQAYLLFYERIF